jgi:cell volume regulation protein A
MEAYLIGIPLLVILSVVASKGAGRYGVPALLIFLIIGMLAGPEGPGRIPFANYGLAQGLGVLALIFILHSGGLDTRSEEAKPVFWKALSLSTLGVVIVAVLVAALSSRLLGFDLVHGILLGAAVASTDVAAVFTILRTRGAGLTGSIRPLLELEAALNDPMSVFLSVGALQLISSHQSGILDILPLFLQQMTLGLVLGYLAGVLTPRLINGIRAEFEGLYPVLSVSLVLLTYGVAQSVGGSGFLAVYVSGLVLGRKTFLHKRSLLLFHDGLAWLGQIMMFLTLGLLVLPSEVVRVAPVGLALSAFLILVARPIGVIACLTPFRVPLREQLMISWAGLRGAVPIVLATYPLLAGIPEARLIFNLVFFVVFSSVLLQGAAIPAISRLLGLAGPLQKRFRFPIEYNPTTNLRNELVEVPVPEGSPVVGRALVELELPQGALVVLIQRNDDVIVPRGGTRIEPLDRLLVLAEAEPLRQVRERVAAT